MIGNARADGRPEGQHDRARGLRRAALVLVAALLAGLVTLAPAHADEAGSGAASGVWAPPTDRPVRIMLAGDSITHQFSGDFTWRYRLWQEFARQQVPVDFVGPFDSVYGAAPHGYLAQWPDEDHAAVGGTTFAVQAAGIADWVRAYTPDIVMVELGTNDLLRGAAPDQLVAIAEAYVANIWAVAPDTMVALSEVYDALAYPGTGSRFGPMNGQYNALLAQLVDRLRSEGHPVRLTHTQTSGWAPRAMTSDGLHPNPSGESYLAQRNADVLHDLGVLPGVPAAWRGPVAWTPPTTATSTVARRGWVVHRVKRRNHRPRVYRTRAVKARVDLRWDDAAAAYRLTRGIVRVYQGKHLVAKRLSPIRGTDLQIRLRPGRYTYTLQGIRGWVVGTPGPARPLLVR